MQICKDFFEKTFIGKYLEYTSLGLLSDEDSALLQQTRLYNVLYKAK